MAKDLKKDDARAEILANLKPEDIPPALQDQLRTYWLRTLVDPLVLFGIQADTGFAKLVPWIGAGISLLTLIIVIFKK